MKTLYVTADGKLLFMLFSTNTIKHSLHRTVINIPAPKNPYWQM